jgi:hypothetical protein
VSETQLKTAVNGEYRPQAAYEAEVKKRLARFRDIARKTLREFPRAMLFFVFIVHGIDKNFVDCFDPQDSAKLLELFHRKPCMETCLPTHDWSIPERLTKWPFT